ncbi:hypothetical protein HC891_11975 [Candidatus Gracilibacteria bacterium]|nr:hypothetical protein [Candidatus Gracilibacteria bacterium]
MLRSFQYAAYTRFFSATEGLVGRPDEVARLEQWTDYWYYWVSAIFVRSYLESAGQASFIPQRHEDLQTLIETYVLDKALYELSYELNNRPAWVAIPLRGILSLLDGSGAGHDPACCCWLAVGGGAAHRNQRYFVWRNRACHALTRNWYNTP